MPGIEKGLHFGVGVRALREAPSPLEAEDTTMTCVFALCANGAVREPPGLRPTSLSIRASDQSARVIKLGH